MTDDIDRDISLTKNYIDRDNPLAKNYIDRAISLAKHVVDKEGHLKLALSVNTISLCKILKIMLHIFYHCFSVNPKF